MLKLVVLFVFLITGAFVGGFISPLLGFLSQGTAAGYTASWWLYLTTMAAKLGGVVSSVVVSVLVLLGVSKVMARMIPLICILGFFIYYYLDWMQGTDEQELN